MGTEYCFPRNKLIKDVKLIDHWPPSLLPRPRWSCTSTLSHVITGATLHKKGRQRVFASSFCSNGSPQLVKNEGKWLMYIQHTHHNVLGKVICFWSEIKLTGVRPMSSLEQCYFRRVVSQLQDTKQKEKCYGSGLHCMSTLFVTDNFKGSR
jgi:hypothetical protein